MEMNSARSDNALLLMVATLIRCSVSEVFLAGFDGFKDGKNGYFDPNYSFVESNPYNVEANQIVSSGLKTLSSRIIIHFLTESLYEKEL